MSLCLSLLVLTHYSATKVPPPSTPKDPHAPLNQ